MTLLSMYTCSSPKENSFDFQKNKKIVVITNISPEVLILKTLCTYSTNINAITHIVIYYITYYTHTQVSKYISDKNQLSENIYHNNISSESVEKAMIKSMFP